MKRKLKGFTLVELVITIAIVIILSVISVPIYRGYTDKAKYAEGYALLGMLLSAQKAYYSEYGNFIVDGHGGEFWKSKSGITGVDASGNKYFSYFYVGGAELKNKENYVFYSGVSMPKEFGANRLMIMYNITLGAYFATGNNYAAFASSLYE